MIDDSTEIKITDCTQVIINNRTHVTICWPVTKLNNNLVDSHATYIIIGNRNSGDCTYAQHHV